MNPYPKVCFKPAPKTNRQDNVQPETELLAPGAKLEEASAPTARHNVDCFKIARDSKKYDKRIVCIYICIHVIPYLLFQSFSIL